MTPSSFFDGGIHGPTYGDGPWLSEALEQIPFRKQKAVANRYSEIYQELVLSDPRQCRYRSNCWLRKVVKKYTVVNNDIVPF